MNKANATAFSVQHFCTANARKKLNCHVAKFLSFETLIRRLIRKVSEIVGLSSQPATVTINCCKRSRSFGVINNLRRSHLKENSVEFLDLRWSQLNRWDRHINYLLVSIVLRIPYTNNYYNLCFWPSYLKIEWPFCGTQCISIEIYASM